MTGKGGPLARARALDDLVLGPSDSPRGWLLNLGLGLHPYLFWLWAPAALVCFGVAGVRASGDGSWLEPLLAGVVLTAMAWASRGLPARVPD